MRVPWARGGGGYDAALEYLRHELVARPRKVNVVEDEGADERCAWGARHAALWDTRRTDTLPPSLCWSLACAGLCLTGKRTIVPQPRAHRLAQ